jgi:hypothetical protein
MPIVLEILSPRVFALWGQANRTPTTPQLPPYQHQ